MGPSEYVYFASEEFYDYGPQFLSEFRPNESFFSCVRRVDFDLFEFFGLESVDCRSIFDMVFLGADCFKTCIIAASRGLLLSPYGVKLLGGKNF